MDQILVNYKPVEPSTWVYLSSLLMIGLYFKFGRLWSLRNLDLIGLILLTPGLLLVDSVELKNEGYLWLFIASGFFMVRLLMDSSLNRRPLLEPNLSVGGLSFIGAALFLFLMGNIVHDPDVAAFIWPLEEWSMHSDRISQFGPGYPPLFTKVDIDLARRTAIGGHFCVVLGIILIGRIHFENYKTGVAVAMLYLLLPSTAQRIGNLEHLLPGMFLVWMVVFYRRPLLSGLLGGLAGGLLFYPIFLMPLWVSFYARRGAFRFLLGSTISIGVLVSLLAMWTDSTEEFERETDQMFGWAMPPVENNQGFWNQEYHEPAYRPPVMAAFAVLCISLSIWPSQKNLGTLISCTAVVMLGIQFWHAHRGGIYIAWYLPLLLLSVFRPNLEDRVAESVVRLKWPPKWLANKLASAKRS